MAAPTAPRAPRLGRPGARSNKNKRLFEGEEGALVNGQKLYYRTTQVGPSPVCPPLAARLSMHLPGLALACC